MFKKIIFLSLIIGSLVGLSAELLKPSDSEQREILTISGKRWVYYTLYRKPITFDVTGPLRIKIYSRVSSPAKVDQYIHYDFGIQVDDQAPFTVKHKQKLSKGVKSQQHPNHFYSHSAKDFFLVPKGKHKVRLVPPIGAAPVVVRVLEDLTTTKGKKQFLTPVMKSTPVKVAVSGKTLNYYYLDDKNDLLLNLDGPATLEMISRVGFADFMGNEQDYRIQIWNGGSLLGTFYFNSERSELSSIVDHADLVPGKWRSCRVALKKGSHKIKIRLLDQDRQVYVRFAKITR